jgi:hypothetical protein
LSVEIRTEVIPVSVTSVVLHDEPDYCFGIPYSGGLPLPMTTGVSFVYCMAIWSAPDVKGTDRAFAIARGFQGTVRLGIFAYSEDTDIGKWCRRFDTKGHSPKWLIFLHGKLQHQLCGFPPEEEIVSALKTVCRSWSDYPGLPSNE